MRIRSLVSEETASEGEVFISQDVPGDSFYVLVNGRVIVYRHDEYGEEIVLAEAEPGECIGEMGYFAKGRRSASVRALEDSQLLRVKHANLEEIFQRSPTLTRNFLGLVTRRLRQTNLRFQEISTSHRSSPTVLQVQTVSVTASTSKSSNTSDSSTTSQNRSLARAYSRQCPGSAGHLDVS